MKKTLRQIAPWIVAALILYFLFRQIPPADVLLAIKGVNIPLFCFFSIIYFLAGLLLDCIGLNWVLKRFSTTVTYKETLLVRGATYLFMLINYNLAQGGIALYLKKAHKAPLFKTFGAILYLGMADFTIMTLLALIVLSFQDIVYKNINLNQVGTSFIIIFLVSLFIWCFFWKQTNHPIILFLRRLRMIDWLVKRDIFYAFRNSSLLDYVKILLVRTPLILLVISSLFMALESFESHIPWNQIFLYGPVIFFVGTIPITPSGLGTVQALCIEFFKPHLSSDLFATTFLSPENILLTASLLWVFANIFLKTLFGFYCLSIKSKSLFEDKK